MIRRSLATPQHPNVSDLTLYDVKFDANQDRELERVMNSPWRAYYRRDVSENRGILISFSPARQHSSAILRPLRQVHNTL